MATRMLLAVLMLQLVLAASGLKLHQCPAGFFCVKSMRRSLVGADNYELPQVCPRGTWSGVGATACTPCEPGYFTWDEASTFCERCELGHMCSAPNVDPRPCPLGTFNAEPGQTCCQVCPAGSYTPRIASFRCERCRPGTYCPINDIKLNCTRTAEPTTTTVTTSTDRNPCLLSNPCCNGGTCQATNATSYVCLCSDGYYGERCEDSTDETTILNVLSRNNWTDVLAVIDVTGSMSACSSAIVDWISTMHEKKTNMKMYVFFNDGDSTPDDAKVIGSTGGIYAINATSLSMVLAVMERAKRMGNGGDGPENDIEALLYGIRQCPTCKNVVLIADNAVTPRDLILLPNVTRPVKVIPCQVQSGSSINPAMLNIALKTGGSLHTVNQDILSLAGVAINETIRIGRHVYRRTPNGFILL